MPIEIIALVLVVLALVVAGVSLYSVRKLKSRIAEIEETPVVSRSSSEPSKVALVINPSKSDAEPARRAVEVACAAAGFEPPLVLETTVEDMGEGMTRKALEEGCDVVIAAGGDGTVRGVAEVLTGKGVTMGLLPLGTGNLMARNLDFDVEDRDVAIQTALHGTTRGVDAVALELIREDGSVDENLFMVMAGIGFDADIMDDTDEALKAKVGSLAYAEAGMRHISGRRRSVTIAIDDGPAQQRKVRSVMIANCGRLQAGFALVPEARIDDGILDIVVMSPRSVAGWLWIAAKTAFRHRGSSPVIDYYQARKVEISLPEPIGSQIDGDPTGRIVGLRAQVQPAALNIRVPDAR